MVSQQVGRLEAELAATLFTRTTAAPSAAEDVSRGTLVRLLPEWRQPKAGVYAVYPATRYVAPKTRAFIDFLKQRYRGW